MALWKFEEIRPPLLDQLFLAFVCSFMQNLISGSLTGACTTETPCTGTNQVCSTSNVCECEAGHRAYMGACVADGMYISIVQ